ncbi:MAG: hypothetical protein J0L88_14155 [Xanthomonadales bacterium]|nr:hypothetical protein [Xanthomonadales bacterium]
MTHPSRWLLLMAAAYSWNASAHCRDEPPGSVATELAHFYAPPALAPAILGFEFADLQGKGTLELVQGGLQRGTDDLEHDPAITVVNARERLPGQMFRTRASLKFEGEYPVVATAIPGAEFGVDGNVVILVTRAKHEAVTRIRVIDGPTWKSIRRCDVDFVAIAAAVAPASDPGSHEVYLQNATSMVIHALPDLQPIRTLASGGGAGFVLAQLDDDDPIEAVLVRTPGRVVDSLSGAVEWEFAPGFETPLVTGNFGPAGEVGFASFLANSSGTGAVNVFETHPYSQAWAISTRGQQVLAVRDIDGDARDELFVAGSYVASPTSTPRGIRVFDMLSRTVRQTDAVTAPFDIAGLAIVPKAGAPGFDVLLEQDTAFRSYPLGSPDSASAEYAERGPFTAFALLPVAPSEPGRVVFTNAYSMLRSLRVHVLDATSWTELGVSPMPYAPGAINIRQATDIMTLSDSPSGTRRVAIAGERNPVALTLVDPSDWSSAWSLDPPNGPDLFLTHTPERLAAVDFNRDGIKDILVGVGMWSSAQLGARLTIIDGRDGLELWRSEALGGYFAHVRDIQIEDSSTADPVALVSGTFGVSAFAFAPGSGQALWNVPVPANGSTRASDDGWLVAAESGIVLSLEEDRSVRWENGSYHPVQAVRQLRPGGPILVATRDRLRWLSPVSGAQIGVSAPVGSSFATGNRWTIESADAPHSVRVTAGGDGGLLRVLLAEPPNDAIFVDGLE